MAIAYQLDCVHRIPGQICSKNKEFEFWLLYFILYYMWVFWYYVYLYLLCFCIVSFIYIYIYIYSYLLLVQRLLPPSENSIAVNNNNNNINNNNNNNNLHFLHCKKFFSYCGSTYYENLLFWGRNHRGIYLSVYGRRIRLMHVIYC